MTAKPRKWTEYTPALITTIQKGVRAVIFRYASHAVEHIEDIAQDVIADIQRRFFSKGRTLHEAQLRTIIRQEALNYQRRKYHPTVSEPMKLIIQTELARMIKTGTRTAASGYTSEHLTNEEWETAKQLHAHGWSLSATSKATGTPIATLQRRLNSTYYKQSTYNNKHTPTFPTQINQETEHALSECATRNQEHHSNASKLLRTLIEETDTLNTEDKRKIDLYLQGELDLSEIRQVTRKLKRATVR